MAICKGGPAIFESNKASQRLHQLRRTVLFLTFSGITTAGDSCGFSDVGTLTRIALANTRRFTTELAQVIKLGPADVTFFHDIDVIDDRRVQGENSFHTHTKAGLTYRNCLADAAMLTGDADAFKRLQAFFSFRLFNAHVNAHGVSGLKLRNVLS